jgi:gliding motility-associated-like protein
MKTKGRIKYQLYFFLCLCAGAVTNGTCAQTYTPLAVSGFTQDVVAESGTDATAVSSTVIDATQHVMYTANFAAINGISSGGVVDNGNIVNGSYTWQMEPFAGNNALYLSNGTVANTAIAGTLTLASPASFSGISLLVFSTEGNNTANVVLNFTDGTIANAGNFLITDWYDNLNPVYNAFGRIVRVAGPTYTTDGAANGNGRMYKLDVNIPCASRPKLLQSVTISYVSGTLSGRILVFAVSGAAYGPLNISSVITDATCNGSNGSISLNIVGNTNPNAYFYKWNTTPQQFTPAISGLAANTYTCTITDLANCSNNYPFVVNAVPVAVVTATPAAAGICPGGTTTITAGATGPAVSGYTWNPGGQSGSSISVSPAATTTYTVSGQDANGCTVTASTTVTVNPVPLASFTASADSICQGSTETVVFNGTASGTATYDWNNFIGATVQSGSGAGPYTLVYNTPGTFTLQLQVTDGCPSAIASKQVVVSERPVADFDINPTPICAGDAVSVTFTGTKPGASTASWNWIGGKVLSGSGFGPYTVSYFNSNLIKVTVKNGACTVVSAAKAVTVTPGSLAAFDVQPPGGCVPATVQFVNQSENANTYKWTFGDGQVSTDANPQHVYGNTGNYTVTLEVSNYGQCPGTLTKTDVINVSTPPTVAFTSVPDTNTIVDVHQANFAFANQSQNATSYLWKFGDGGSSTLTDPSHKYELAGNYSVTLYAMNGACIDSVTHQYYKVIPDKEFIVPNAFSPNGDGINDRWEIDRLKQYPGCTVTVFNRWGQEVFKSQGYQQPWDGNFKGQPVPLATYYYVITLPGKQTYSGWVVILK